jgi:hypothetical protein
LKISFGVHPSGTPAAAQSSNVLWRIGEADNRHDEFALSPTNYTKFLSRFGSLDGVYYIGLSQPESDWPYLLPGRPSSRAE